MFNKSVLLLCVFLCSHAYANGYDAHFSAINGVVISNLNLSDESSALLHGFLGQAYTGEDEKSIKKNITRTKSFLNHCSKNKVVYIAEYGRSAFKCNAEYFPESFSAENTYGFTLNSIINQKITSVVKLAELEVYTISLKPLKYYKLKFEPLSKQELARYSRLAKIYFPKPKKIEGNTYRLLKNHAYSYFDSGRNQKPIKYRQNAHEFIILPIYGVDDELSSDLISAVFIKSNHKIKYLGELGGCVTRAGADVDNDGFSEIITGECEPGEGSYILYNKLYPSIETILSTNSS